MSRYSQVSKEKKQLQTPKCEVLYGMGGKNWYVEDSVPKTIVGPNCF